MANPDPTRVIVREIEREYQLVRDDLQRALLLMRNFMAIDGYTIDKDDIKVALNLSLLQRLCVRRGLVAHDAFALRAHARARRSARPACAHDATIRAAGAPARERSRRRPSDSS